MLKRDTDFRYTENQIGLVNSGLYLYWSGREHEGMIRANHWTEIPGFNFPFRCHADYFRCKYELLLIRILFFREIANDEESVNKYVQLRTMCATSFTKISTCESV